jgi:8-oxo-dGTP pyrophosphatase MutT (NUDIX family)
MKSQTGYLYNKNIHSRANAPANTPINTYTANIEANMQTHHPHANVSQQSVNIDEFGNKSNVYNSAYKNNTWSRNMSINFFYPPEYNENERIAGASSSVGDDRIFRNGMKENIQIGLYNSTQPKHMNHLTTHPIYQNNPNNTTYQNSCMANRTRPTAPLPVPPPPPPPLPPSYQSASSKYSIFKNNKWEEECKYNKRSSFFMSATPKVSTIDDITRDSSIPQFSSTSSPSPPPPPPHISAFSAPPSNYCNNCGRNGHGFYQCKNPITSYGVIIFRYATTPTGKKERQYLMIRRRDTISYVDFLRGKYSISNRKYIKTLFKDMTEYEQNQIMTQSFEYLWCELWKNNEPNPHDKIRMSQNKWKKNVDKSELPNSSGSFSAKEEEPEQEDPLLRGNETSTEGSTEADMCYGYDIEGTAGANSVGGDRIFRNGMEENSKMNTKDKFNILQKGLIFNQKKHFTIAEIVDEIRKERASMGVEPWKEPEWGFCKGRRNYKENDYDCAVREMREETGYSKDSMTAIKNVNTFEEIFIGSNFKCYKHKYYLMYMTYENSLKTGAFEKTEVSCIKWASLNECLGLIRSYNVEKKRMITNVDNSLSKYTVFESR